MSLDFSHPLDANSRRRAPSAASKGSAAIADARESGSFSAQREPRGYFDTSPAAARTGARHRASSHAVADAECIDAHLGARASMGMGMAPARATAVPGVLQGIGQNELDLLNVRFDAMTEDEIDYFFGEDRTEAGAISLPRRSSTDDTVHAGLAIDASNAPGGLTTPLMEDAGENRPADSPNTPRARPFPMTRKSTAAISALTGSIDSPLFPPSPPGGLSSRPRDGSQSGELQALKTTGISERGAIRTLSRIAKEMRNALLALERENEELRQRLADAEQDTRGNVTDRRRGSAGRPPRRSNESSRTRSRKSGEFGRGGLVLDDPADQGDAISIHDSLAEALSTYLPSDIDAISLHSNRSRQTTVSMSASSTPHCQGQRPASSSVSSRTEAEVPPRARRTSRAGSLFASTSGSAQGLQVGTAQDLDAAPSSAGLVPLPTERKRDKHSSWTSNLWSWTTGSAAPPSATKKGFAFDQVAESPEEGAPDLSATIRPTSSARFGPTLLAKASAVVQPSRVAVAPGDSVAQSLTEHRRDTPSPAFRAIALATRILTPDPASILVPGMPTSSLISYLAHTLISNAQEEGVSFREQRSRRASSATRPTTGSTGDPLGDSYGQSISATLHSALVVKLTPQNHQGRSSDARKSLLRSLSHRTGIASPPHRSSPRRPPATPPSRYTDSQSGDSTPSSPTRSMPAVELGSIGGLDLKPPSLLPRRATLEDFLHLDEGSKVASQFDGKGVKAYTDRYGFVYDVKHAQALVESQSNTTTTQATAQPADDWADQKRDRYTSPARSIRPSLTQDSTERASMSAAIPECSMQRQHSDPQVRFVPPDSATSQSLTGLTNSPGDAGASFRRPRSATTSGFGQPTPVKPAISEQSLTVSASGSVDLAPTITAGPLRSVSGTIRPVKKTRGPLDSVRKPVSALLSQLTETYEREEQQRTRKWDTFLHERISGSSGTSIRSLHESSKWQGDLLGLGRIGSGKNGQEARRELNRLVRSEGIPMALRAQIWAEFAGAKDAFEPGVFNDLLDLHKEREPPIIAEIDKDVGRTFASNVYFGGDGVGCQKLRRLLIAYSWRDPDIGYCQGMNLLAATLLLTYEEEERAFYTFVCTIQTLLPPDFYTASLLGSRTEQAVLAGYVKELCPDITNKLDDLGVDLSAVTFGWILSLFTNCLPVETLFRVWDVFYAEGNVVIIRTAVAILKLGEPALLASESVPELFKSVNSIEKRLHRADKLLHLQHHLQRSIRKSDLEARRKRALLSMS